MMSTLLDRQQEAADDQAKLREAQSHRVSSSDPARAMYFFGKGRERMLLQSIQPDDFTPAGALRLTQLGEAYALQGRFVEAAAVTKSEAHQKQYEAQAKAVAALGSRQCLCPIYWIEPSKTDAKGIRVENHHPIKQIFDGERYITFLRCRNCNALSANGTG